MYNGWNIILEEKYFCFFVFIYILNKSTATLQRHFSWRFLYTTICSSGWKHKRSENKQEGMRWLNTDQWSNMFPLWTIFLFHFSFSHSGSSENNASLHGLIPCARTPGKRATIHYKKLPQNTQNKSYPVTRAHNKDEDPQLPLLFFFFPPFIFSPPIGRASESQSD